MNQNLNSVTISLDDSRSLRALTLAVHATEWQKITTIGGQTFYLIPSQTDATTAPVRYRVSDTQCNCHDFEHRSPEPCKHILAVRLARLIHAAAIIGAVR